MSQASDIERGNRAQEVLDNPVYRAAFVVLEQELIERWKKSASQDDRERMHRELTSLQRVQTYLSETMQSGKLARLKPTTTQRAMELVRSATGGLR